MPVRQRQEVQGLPRPLAIVFARSNRLRYTAGAMAIRPELREELLTLPEREREELADQLYDSLEGEARDPAWEQAWTQELGRRVADIADGRVTLVDADEVHAELRAELRDLPR